MCIEHISVLYSLVIIGLKWKLKEYNLLGVSMKDYTFLLSRKRL